MNPLWGQMSGVITVILLLIFIGIWIWAWRPWHKKSFDRMAKVPMQDKDAPMTGSESEDAEK